jgi:hypothetical protein
MDETSKISHQAPLSSQSFEEECENLAFDLKVTRAYLVDGLTASRNFFFYYDWGSFPKSLTYLCLFQACYAPLAH